MSMDSQAGEPSKERQEQSRSVSTKPLLAALAVPLGCFAIATVAVLLIGAALLTLSWIISLSK